MMHRGRVSHGYVSGTCPIVSVPPRIDAQAQCQAGKRLLRLSKLGMEKGTSKVPIALQQRDLPHCGAPALLGWCQHLPTGPPNTSAVQLLPSLPTHAAWRQSCQHTQTRSLDLAQLVRCQFAAHIDQKCTAPVHVGLMPRCKFTVDMLHITQAEHGRMQHISDEHSSPIQRSVQLNQLYCCCAEHTCSSDAAP